MLQFRCSFSIICDAMPRRITVTMDSVLEQALREAPARLGIPRSASASERLRAWARVGYERSLEDELDRRRLETFAEWASDREIDAWAEATLEAAAEDGLFRDD
jgi:hypothetical protein